MKNPYYYLFYRFNQFLNKNGDNEWGPIFGVSVLIGWNFIVIFMKLLPITKENFDRPYKYSAILLAILIFFINTVLFLNKNRVNKIVERHEKESRISKRIGGWIIVFYMILSLGLLFI